MAARYALAVLSGYGGFLLMLRAWLEYRQGIWDERYDRCRGTSDLAPNPIDCWPGGDSPRFSLDLDDLWWLVLLIVAVLGALITIGYVIYDAPQLLAEVALDAGLVSAMYHRIRHEPEQHWSRAALRRPGSLRRFSSASCPSLATRWNTSFRTPARSATSSAPCSDSANKHDSSSS